ncbi:hypothetical protein G6F61_011733 [Rhizopus arrhizus]|nr:hypothetical protein G6F61_011733 [Rhizopus arrhizus]
MSDPVDSITSRLGGLATGPTPNGDVAKKSENQLPQSSQQSQTQPAQTAQPTKKPGKAKNAQTDKKNQENKI